MVKIFSTENVWLCVLNVKSNNEKYFTHKRCAVFDSFSPIESICFFKTRISSERSAFVLGLKDFIQKPSWKSLKFYGKKEVLILY